MYVSEIILWPGWGDTSFSTQFSMIGEEFHAAVYIFEASRYDEF